MLESTVTIKGQTTLPKEVREALGLKPGDRVRYVLQRDGVRIVRPKSLIDMAGCLGHEGPPVSLEEMEEGIADAAAERYRRAVEQ